MQRNGEALEKLFYFIGIVSAPSPCTLSGYVFQGFDGITVPAAESLNNERRKGNSLRATMVEVSAVFREETSSSALTSIDFVDNAFEWEEKEEEDEEA